MHDAEHNDHSGGNRADGDKIYDYYVDDDHDMMMLQSMMGVLIMAMMRTATVCILSRTKVYDCLVYISCKSQVGGSSFFRVAAARHGELV